MNITITKKENYTVLSFQSEKLTSELAPELKAQLLVLSNEGVKNIIIDLEKARYCDSSGISALLNGDRACKEKEGKFILTSLQPTVKKVIEISQLHNILNIHDSLASAEEMFK